MIKAPIVIGAFYDCGGGKMQIERLSHNNLNNFNELLNESKDTSLFKYDFYDYYLKKSFIIKYFIRKNVKLLLNEGKYIGYIWFDFKSLKNLTINDLYVKKEYINELNPYILKGFNSDFIVFEMYETTNNLEIVQSLNMKRIRISHLMKHENLSISENKKSSNLKDITFVPYERNKHSKLRCAIQNKIFENENRSPLTVDDIYYDEGQDYFLDNMSFFLKVKDKYIGYGQIIFMRSMYMIVNFGILKEFRSKGYGNIFLNKLISNFKEKINSDIFIRVDSNNRIAKRLYEKSGFENKGIISTWLYTNKK